MKQTMCCLGMYDNKILLKTNNFYNGFTELYWQKDKEKRSYKAKLTKPKVLIGNMSEGYYAFYTKNPSTFVETELMTFYYHCDLPSFAVNRLYNVADIVDTSYSSMLKTELTKDYEDSPVSLLDILYKRYLSLEDHEEFEEDIFYKLITCQEAYENLQYSNNNRDGIGFARLIPLPNPTIYVPQDVTTVKVYQNINGKQKFYGLFYPKDSEVSVPLPVGLFDIYLLQGSCLFSVLKHCNLSKDSMIRLWDDYQSNNMDYLDIVEDNLSSTIDFDAFTVEETKKYKEEIGMTPSNPIIPRVKVTENKYERGVELLISGVSFADVSRHTFFVSGRDIDFMYESVQNEFFPLIANGDSFTVNFEPAQNMIDTEALLYVIDEQGNIVSRITRCIFDEDSTTSLADYYEKIRVAEILSYGRRLSAQVLSSYQESWNYVQEMITRCIENNDINIDNILVTLLADVNNAPSDINRDLLCVEILKDYVASNNYDLNFFSSGGFLWKPYLHLVVTEPSEEGYILCILANFEGSNVYSKHYIHSFPDKTVDLLLNQYARYVVFAISEVDYSISGFFYLNTINGFLKTYLLNMEVR